MKEGLLSKKRRECRSLETKIDRCVKDLEYYAFPFDGVASIETDKVVQAAQELKDLCHTWKMLCEEVERLEKEM